MRTPESRIKEAILSPVEEIRVTAAVYFARSRCEDTSIMPLVIEAVERHGRYDAVRLLLESETLPQTQATTRWLLDELHNWQDWESVEGENYAFALALIVCQADLEQLADPAEDIVTRPEFPDELKPWLSERVEMRAWDWDTAWSELEQLGRRIRNKGLYFKQDLRRAANLVEALARHRDRVGEILPLLERKYQGYDEDVMHWLESILVDLAGKAQLVEAVPTLVTRLEELDFDLNEASEKALGVIGGDVVVQALTAKWLEGDDYYRQSVAEILGRVHTDLSAEKCLEFLAAEEDSDTKEFLATALLDNFVPESIELIRPLILQEEIDPEASEVRSRLVVAATIMGVSFPEYSTWYKEEEESDWGRGHEPIDWRIRESYRESRDEVAWEDAHEEDWEDSDIDDEAAYREDDDEDDFDEEYVDREVAAAEPYSPPQPIRREQARVGRNDPCPCGSGKKYKKCCMGKERS